MNRPARELECRDAGWKACTTILLLWVSFGLVIFTVGCHPLPPGELSTIRPISDASREGNVYLLRGWRDLWSEGVDQLAGELRQSGVHAEVFRAEQCRDLASAITDRYRGVSHPQPLVLIGFSYGADDAIEVARQLNATHQAVDLLVTIDPVTPPPVPANVKTCYNYFQTNGLWDVFPWLRGISLHSDGVGKLININLRQDRRDLLEPNTGHSNIAANPKLHREIVLKVIAVCSLRLRSDAAPSLTLPRSTGEGK